MKDLDLYSFISLILVLVGGINLGLLGLFDVNLIMAILGVMLGRLLFIIIGAAAGYLGYMLYIDRMKKV